MNERVVTVASRFNGPPGSGNGGYVAGLLAGFVSSDDAVTARLRLPPPLERTLRVRVDGAAAELLDGADLVARAEPAVLDLKVPEVPSLAGVVPRPRPDHPFPTCFGCGPERSDGIGANLSPVGPELWAGRWRPTALLPHVDGLVVPEVVWSALDCPSAQPVAPDDGPTHVLGTITVRLEHPVSLDTDHVLLAWEQGREGRKAYSASAIVASDGTVCGRAEAVWIALS